MAGGTSYELPVAGCQPPTESSGETEMSGSLDQIHIRDLVVSGILGINPDERIHRQDIMVNVTLWADTRDAAGSDDIEDAVNYRTITKQIIAHIEKGEPMLVERLVAELARICLDADERVAAVEMTVEKPGALRHARSVGITIYRTRNGDDDA
jgi:D-erythro-7,8-dihydroneopterin triphosphate epimerase